MAGMGSLLTAAWLPGIAELFNHAGWFFMRAMIEASDWFTTLPGAYHFVPPPPPWFFLIYYGVLVAIAIPALARKIRLRLAGLLALLVGGWLAGSPYSASNRLTVLPFEDGHAVFFQGRSPDRHLLIDSGRIGPSERVVAPFLHAQGISRLPRLGLTHGDLGQIGGAEFVRTNFNAGKIIAGPLPFRSPAYRALIAQFERVPGLLQTVQAGDALDGWQVLHPAVGETYSQADDGLLVLRGEFGGTRCLLLSDLGRPGQNRLMAKNPPEALRAEIVMVGKPTEGDPLADALLLAIQPKLVIVADAMYPAQARASRSLQQRLARYRIPVVYTRLSGAVTIEFRSEGWRARTMNGEQVDGRDLKRLTALPVASTDGEEQ
jgi:beta-lactamase superfamily II metal-dependent hydrolase